MLSPRLDIHCLQPRSDKKISIINCYSPTGAANKSKLNAFYNELGKVIRKEISFYKFVDVDFNARIETMKKKHYRIGKFGLGDRSENGGRLAALVSTLGLFHGNSFFVKKEHRPWTCELPN
ncbi:hypothetical protein DICVIV_11295 [Dictyocaulus viviparus]|uniref:Uncharacterized protein n=1 Tax=Dictyocaulus viviparus TaxID=29172 RepID=A0A0D8XG79_DICVI|nr:hypothetical protein DICVIV_11295 [Dictyocaulus viviparus]